MAQEILECPIESLRLSTKAHVAAIEYFNETILHWFARLDELQSDTMFFAQSATVTENQFWSGEFFKIPAGRIGELREEDDHTVCLITDVSRDAVLSELLGVVNT